MKIKKNGRVISLSESDLQRIVKRTLNEQSSIASIDPDFCNELTTLCEKHGWSCDCEEVLNILEPKSVEDNPFGI